MKILIGAWFKLPRLGADVFNALVRGDGVRYDKDLGFMFDAATDIEAAVKTMGSALGEEVELTVRCYVCGRESCGGCPYAGSCDRRRVSPACLCAEHSPEHGSFGLYQKTFSDNFS